MLINNCPAKIGKQYQMIPLGFFSVMPLIASQGSWAFWSLSINLLFKRKPWGPSLNISYILVAILIWFAASYWLAARDYLPHSAVLIFLLISLILGVGVLTFSSFAPLLSQVVANALGGRMDRIQFSLEHQRYMMTWQSIWSKLASWTYSGITLDQGGIKWGIRGSGILDSEGSHR